MKIRHIALAGIFFINRALFSAPVMSIQNDLFDAGAIVQGDVVRHSYLFENKGDANLQISKVSASCGCTIAKVDRSLLKPGERGTLFVTFESAKFTGKVKKTVTLANNDRENPQALVTLAADVREAWFVKPAHITFNAASDGLHTSESFIPLEITNKQTAAIRFVDVSSGSGEISFDKSFPIVNAGVAQNSVFQAQIMAKPASKITDTRYTWVDVRVEYEDGRKLAKRIGVSIKKCR